MPYQVVKVEGRETTPFTHNNEVVIFQTAHDAQAYAAYLSQVFQGKYQPRRIKEDDDDWKAKEVERFRTGHYTKLPWHDEAWVAKNKDCEFHYPHVSRQDQTKIAYVPDAENGERDVKTVVKPSKYLATFYSKILTEDEIRTLVAKYKKAYDKDNALLFAYDAKEIVHVYRNGPRSCMSGGMNNYRSKIHPVSVYAGPDLAVAYVERGKHIVARSVVWPKKKIYSRLYGDMHLLETLLIEEGYHAGRLTGARLTKHKQGGRYVCPYLDGSVNESMTVSVGRKYLKICYGDGKHIATNQDGFCGWGFNCPSCQQETTTKVGRAMTAVNGQYWCNPCYTSALAESRIFTCGYSGNPYTTDVAVTMADGSRWHRSYANDAYRAFRCGDCSQLFPVTQRAFDLNGRPVTRNGRYVCRPCATVQQELAL